MDGKQEIFEGQETTPRRGKVAFVEGLGFFITPKDNDHAVVGFNNLDPDELPEGLNVGDEVSFSLDEESKGVNAAKWTKIEPEKK